MAITRIKNNQITDATIVGSTKLVDNSVTSGKLENNLTYGSNLTVTGDLTVNGTTTTISTTNTTVEDPVLVLASQQTAAAAVDVGFIAERGTDQNVAWIWDESADEFAAVFTNDAESNTTVTVASYANAQVGTLTASALSTSGNLDVTGNLTVGGTSGFTGLMTAGDIDAATLDTTGNSTIGGTLGVTGNTSLSTVSTSGLATLASTSVTGNATVGGTLGVTGNTTLTTMSTSGLATLASTSVTGNATVGGTLGVTGNTTLSTASVTSTLDVAGLSSLDGGIDVDGAFTVADVTGNISTTGTLSVTGTSNFTGTMTAGNIDSTTLDVTGAATVGTTLGVTGAVTMGSDVTINGGLGETFTITDGAGVPTTTFEVNTLTGAVSSGNIAVTGTLSTTGESTLASATISDLTDNQIVIAGIGGALEGSANLTFDGTTFEVGTAFDVIAASGNTAIGGTLTVTGATDLNGALTAGNITLDAASTFDAGANKLTNLADPTLNQDAATKAYVDSVAAGGWTLTDGTTSQTISGGDTLTLQGTANEVDVAVSAIDTMTIGLPSDVTIGNALTVTGAATVGTTLAVSGASNLAAINATGLASLDGGIDVDGVFTVADTTGNVSTTGTLAAGNTTVTGTLGATGLASLDGGIDVDGQFTVADITGAVSTTSTLNADGATTLGSTLGVTGVSNLDGGIAVDTSNFTVDGTTGAVATASTLDAAGLASLDGGIDVDGAFTVADTTGNISTSGTLTVTGATDLNGATTMGTVTFDAASTIDMGGNKITNMADPTVANDATTKSYVDALVSSGTVWRDPVRDPDLVGVTATEPVSPQTGGGYIATASGTWTGSVAVTNGTYVYWDGAAWIFVQQIAANDRFIIGAEHGTIESSLYDLGFRNGDLVQYSSGAFNAFASYTTPNDAGYQVIDFTVAKATGDATGFANDATVYVLDVSTDVGSGETLSQVQVTGSAAQTIGSLVTEINTDLDTTFGAGNVVATLEAEGHIHITNTATAARLTISEGTAVGTGMLATLTNFEQIFAGVEDGTTVICNDPESAHYSHTYMYSDDANTWTEISGPGAIDAGDNLAFTGNVLNVIGGAGSNLDADLLDAQQGSYYLDWTNTTNKPDPTITLGGDLTGSVTLTDLGNGTLTATVVDDSHNHIIANVDGLQAALDAKLNNSGTETMDGDYTVTTGNSISWVDAPTLGNHLTNKTYVDGELAAGFTLTDGTTPTTISKGDTLTVNGTTNEVEVATGVDSLTIGLPADVTISNSLSVTGNVSATGTATISGLATLNGGIAVDGTAFTVADTSGNVSTSGTLSVTGTSSFTGTMTAGNIDSATLDTTGNVTVGGTLGVTGATTLSSTLGVTGAATLSSTLAVTSDTTVGGDLTVTGATDLNGYTTLAGMNVDRATSVVAGSLVIGETYAITSLGTSDFTLVGAATNTVGTVFTATGAGTGTGTVDSGFVSMGGNLITNVQDPIADQDAATKAYVDSQSASGWTITDGTTSQVISGGDSLTLQGTANEVDVAVSAVDIMTIGLPSNVTISDTLAVTNTATLGALAVTGTSTLTGALTANGGTSTTTLSTSGLATLNSATVSTTLGVTGATTLTGALAANGGATTTTLNATGAVDFDTTLNVDGASTLRTTGVTGVLTVTGSAAIDNITIDGNDITANSGTEVTINEAGADVNFRVEGDTDTNLFITDAGTDSVLVGTATTTTDVKFKVGGTDAVMFSSGTTLERPAIGVAGMMRYNTNVNQYEYYDGTAWQTFGTEFTVIASETFAGDDVTTAFTLSSTQTTASCIVSINGVVQQPTTAYSVSGTTLTFTGAPATGDTIEVRELTTTTTVTGINDGSGSSVLTATASNFQLTGDIVPTVDATYNLGSATFGFGTIYGTATTAQYADLAEMYVADAEIAPGTVVCFGGTAEVTTCMHDADAKVAGVVSTNPAYLMNSTVDGVAVALTGRVPCKVSGSVKKGDMMVSDGKGGARAEANPAMGTVIGKALEDSEGEAVIEIVVGRM